MSDASTDPIAAQRRELMFHSIDEVLREVDALLEGARAGRVKTCGNWTLGQILNHLAAWAEYSYTGMPMKVPWFVRLLLRGRRHKFINEPMRAGVRIPKVEGGTLATEPAEVEPAAGRYRAVLERLKREHPNRKHPIFGDMPHEDWIKLQLRHAELHLGFARIA
jgi:hypothetical protein